MIRMKHYISEDKHGNIHVQNAIMGMFGQHHVHTPAGYKRWAKQVAKQDIVRLKKTLCTCGLHPGEVVDGDPKAADRKVYTIPEGA